MISTKIRTIELRRNLCLLVFVLLLSGCAANRFQAPVSTFRDKTQQTINVLSDFYSSRNSYEIDLYLQDVAANKDADVLKTDAEGHPTPLGKPIFSPASIKARNDALVLIGIYASRLFDLANTGAPAKFQSATTLLGQNLSSLDKTFEKLQGTADPTANKFIGPISSLIGTIGQMFLEHKRDELIKMAVDKGAPSVDAILSQMKDDMDSIFSVQIITGAGERLATLTRAYNNDHRNLTYEQRIARLSVIKAAAAEASASVGSAPAGLVTSMIEAHKALVQAVSSGKRGGLGDLAALNSAFESWTNTIQTLSGQIKLLIH